MLRTHRHATPRLPNYKVIPSTTTTRPGRGHAREAGPAPQPRPEHDTSRGWWWRKLRISTTLRTPQYPASPDREEAADLAEASLNSAARETWRIGYEKLGGSAACTQRRASPPPLHFPGHAPGHAVVAPENKRSYLWRCHPCMPPPPQLKGGGGAGR